jgi:hypothetical protein
MDKMLAAHTNDTGFIGKLARSMTEPAEGLYRWPDGHFSSVAPPDLRLAEVESERCFQTEDYSVGDRGLRSVTEQPRRGDSVSLPAYLGYGDTVAQRVGAASAAERDKALVDYFNARKDMGLVIHRFFGDPGLQLAFARYAAPAHQAAIALLRERLAAPDFAPALNPVERAELSLLAAAPQDFVSCTARRAQKKA